MGMRKKKQVQSTKIGATDFLELFEIKKKKNLNRRRMPRRSDHGSINQRYEALIIFN